MRIDKSRPLLAGLVLILGTALHAEDGEHDRLPWTMCRFGFNVEEWTFEETITFLRDGLHIPISVDPFVTFERPPVLTFGLRGMNAGPVITWIGRLAELDMIMDDHGGVMFVPKSTGDDHAPSEAQGVSVVAFDKTRPLKIDAKGALDLWQQAGVTDIHPNWRRALATIERRIAIHAPVPWRPPSYIGDAERSLEALFGDIRPAPFHTLRRVIDIEYDEQPFEEILADLASRADLPIRLAGQRDLRPIAGLPVITMKAERITIAGAIDAICAATFCTASEAGDGSLVIHDDFIASERVAWIRSEVADRRADIAHVQAVSDGSESALEDIRGAQAALAAFQAEHQDDLAMWAQRRSGNHLDIIPGGMYRIADVTLEAITINQAIARIEHAYGVQLGRTDDRAVDEGEDSEAPVSDLVTLHLEGAELRHVLRAIEFWGVRLSPR